MTAPNPLRQKSRRKQLLRIGVIVVVLGAAVGWFHIRPRPVEPCDLASYKTASRDALLLSPDPFGDTAERVAYLDQGWEPRDSMDFYTRTQGSRLMPYAWFLALEQADNEKLFRDAQNMSRLRYLPQKPTPCNPDGLPVGFVKDPHHATESTDYIGLTCAACHTTEIHYNKTAYRIDGGPGMGDADTFLMDLTRAIKATLDDPAKFDRFAMRVLKRARGRDELRKELETAYRVRSDYNTLNHPKHPYGFARLDAFGRIMNNVLVDDLDVHDESQKCSPDAPVSYPFLWDAPHHDFVQWNGFGANNVMGSEALGGLARNVGEVLGVFGEVHVSKPNTALTLVGYKSSARMPDLLHLENLVRKLHSPQWPKELPPIDETKRKAGAKLFEAYCQRCHQPIDRADPNRRIKAVLMPIESIGTDPRMATNFATRRAKTGRVEHRRMLFMVGDRFGKEAPADDILLHTIVGVILSAPANYHENARMLDLRKRKHDGPGGEANLLVYKARPLNGIWATAPYLHNGSVPNLHQMLLPSEKRVTEFYVGRRELDPTHVGFRTEPFDGGFRFRTTDDEGKPIPGNSNVGHDYGTGKPKRPGGDDLPALTDEERWQLIEYLKSL